MLNIKEFEKFVINHPSGLSSIKGGGFDTGGGTHSATQNGQTCTFDYDSDYSTQGDSSGGWKVSYYGVVVGNLQCQ